MILTKPHIFEKHPFKVQYRILFLSVVFFIIQLPSFGQGIFWKYNKYKIKERVILKNNDTITEAEVASAYKKKKPKAGKRYYWYKQQEIKNTEEGYDGRLLHGMYKRFDPKHNLLEKGTFKYGLKHKKWTTWKDNGDLDTVLVWRNGRLKQKKKQFKLKQFITKLFPAKSKEPSKKIVDRKNVIDEKKISKKKKAITVKQSENKPSRSDTLSAPKK